LLTLFPTILLVCGKVNFTNLSRYSDLSERTYRRQYSQSFAFVEFNQHLIAQAIGTRADIIAAIDCSFVPKSGKATYGVDWFYNGSAAKSEQGLEISVIAVVDVEARLGYPLSVEQTPATRGSATSRRKRNAKRPPQGRSVISRQLVEQVKLRSCSIL
jgi:hypothetical protein